MGKAVHILLPSEKIKGFCAFFGAYMIRTQIPLQLKYSIYIIDIFISNQKVFKYDIHCQRDARRILASN